MPAEEVPGRNISLLMLSRIHWTRNPHYEVASAQQVKCSAINWVVSCEKKKYWINKCHVKSNESHIRIFSFISVSVSSYHYQFNKDTLQETSRFFTLGEIHDVYIKIKNNCHSIQVFQRISKRKIRKMEMMGVADDEWSICITPFLQ